jgi:hypothetical protein
MAKLGEPYVHVVAESYRDETGGIRIRPAPGQPFPQTLRIEGSHALGWDYPVGTRFRVKVKLTDREGKKDYLYTSWQWQFEILSLGTEL